LKKLFLSKGKVVTLHLPVWQNTAPLKEQSKKTMKNARLPLPKGATANPLPSSEAIARLWSALDDHMQLQAPVPARTAKLVNAGDRKMSQKLVEEAGEAALAAILKDRTELVRESADLIYHLTLLWASLGVRPEEIWAEMAEREAAYGLAEKRAKTDNDSRSAR
jgi:phosphoribosyl-ATP pyrophosphohydrolase